MNETLLEQLNDWLRIPSISSGGGDPADLDRAAQWAVDRIVEAGGEAEIVQTEVNPLVVGELKASSGDAPTVMIYGHYDVQSPEPVDAWTTPPFEPTIRGDRLYARGAADDKGNFFPLLFVACELARAGTLPVNIRVLIEGEEEVAGVSAGKWLLADDRGADVCIVFDGGMLDEDTPALTLGVRGMVQLKVTIRTAPRDLHSGVYGGSVLNATHVMHSMLAQVLPGPDGRLRPELRAGVLEPTDAELESWAHLPPGADVISEVGGRPLDEHSGTEYYRHNWADASIDVNGFAGGDAVQRRTIIPATAQAVISLRLAPGQDSDQMAKVLQELMLSAAPEGTEIVEVLMDHGDPAVFDPGTPALQLAQKAIERGTGKAPALVRSGGSIGVLAAFAQRNIPVVLSGFSVAEDAFHAPDESYRLEGLRLGEATARALYEELAKLPHA